MLWCILLIVDRVKQSFSSSAYQSTPRDLASGVQGPSSRDDYTANRYHERYSSVGRPELPVKNDVSNNSDESDNGADVLGWC